MWREDSFRQLHRASSRFRGHFGAEVARLWGLRHLRGTGDFAKRKLRSLGKMPKTAENRNGIAYAGFRKMLMPYGGCDISDVGIIPWRYWYFHGGRAGFGRRETAERWQKQKRRN